MLVLPPLRGSAGMVRYPRPYGLGYPLPPLRGGSVPVTARVLSQKIVI